MNESPLSKFYRIIDNGDARSKIEKFPEFPRIIELEITNHCNFHCIMCKTGLNLVKRDKGNMNEATYKLLMNEINKFRGGLAIKFVGQGEPLLNPLFLDFAAMAKEAGHICHLTTNGSMLTKHIMQGLIDMGFDSVKFSFQGVDHKSYAIMRQREDFEELIEKIKEFKSLRGSKMYPYITVATSLTEESEEEVFQFKKMCNRDVCDKLEIGKTILEDIDVSRISDDRVKSLILERKKRLIRKKRLPICNQVWDVITVRWNGDVSSCCGDIDGLMVLGNINETSIKELWMCPKQQYYREILAENRYDELPVCRDCYDYMGYMENNE